VCVCEVGDVCALLPFTYLYFTHGGVYAAGVSVAELRGSKIRMKSGLGVGGLS
jgi:hypothetical protein